MPQPTTYHRAIDVDFERCQKALARRAGTLVLHSGSDWGGSGRSALLFDPRWTWRQRQGERARLTGRPPSSLDPGRPALRWPFEILGQARTAGDGPSFCGIAGYYSYECGLGWAGVEEAPEFRPDGAGVEGAPESRLFDVDDVWLGAYDRALVHHADGRLELWVAHLGALDPDETALTDRWEEAQATLRQIQGETPSPRLTGAVPAAQAPTFFSRPWHRERVETIHDHLRRGDCYQINLTGFASTPTHVDPYEAFRVESRRNPVAFSAYLRTEDAVLTSHSPERLLCLRADQAETAPIKGTLGRSHGTTEQLLRSVKDQAEHVMIVDLCRNDLGRNAVYGSVSVPHFRQPLELRGLVHLVSRITARIEPERRAHVLEDLFPGGSVTGAPKRRAMEIIAELETYRRGPYTGSFGYLDVTGHGDWNIAIRTAVWQDGWVHFGCGGGIVLDSDPEAEYEEARLKAASFFESLREAESAPATAIASAASNPGTAP